MMDGGGYDTNDTFFKGAGPISALLNVAKIAPYGQSETPREQIGYRDFTDMTETEVDPSIVVVSLKVVA